MSFSYVLLRLPRIEEDRQSELALQDVESPRTTKRVIRSSGLSTASLAVLERNQELEHRLSELEKVVAEGNRRQSGPSRLPSRISSASAALPRRNEELEKELARLENLAKNEGSVRSASSGHLVQLLMNKRRDDEIRILELKRMLRQAQELDLAFVVDATGSMGRSIEEVKNLPPKIANDVKKAFPKLKLRVAFVPYRDYAEYDQDEDEKCDFTDSFEGPESVFVTAIARVKATGGGDNAEDVFSGLERVATLRWRSKTRVLIHIGDAPCHGKEFHEGVPDHHPKGDLKGRDISQLLEALRYKCQILNYLFCHMNGTTQKMLKVFRLKAPQGGWIQEEKLDKISKLLEVVVSASCKSIAVSSRIVGGGPPVLRYLPMACCDEIPEWNALSQKQGAVHSYKFPATLDDLFKIVSNNESLELELKPSLRVKIARRPFLDEGSLRWPYHALVQESAPWIPPRRMVVKRFKDIIGQSVSKVHTLEAYCEQMEVQTVAAFLAEQFNQELERFSGFLPYKTVEFTSVSVLKVENSRYYNMEKWLDGRWIRYSNNTNYVNTKEYAATLQAFSHWTYQRSDGLLMVTDLQGVQVESSNGKNVFMLCDPAIHCKNVHRYELTNTNWSTPGMESFFETHRCNNICRSLKLTPKSTSFTLTGTVIK